MVENGQQNTNKFYYCMNGHLNGHKQTKKKGTLEFGKKKKHNNDGKQNVRVNEIHCFVYITTAIIEKPKQLGGNNCPVLFCFFFICLMV